MRTFLIVSSIEFPFKPQGNICIGFHSIGLPKGGHAPVLMERSVFPYQNWESYKNSPFVLSQHPSLKHIIIIVIYFIKNTFDQN